MVTYLRILSLGAGLGAVMIVGNAALRAAGDTRTPFVTMIVVNVVNVGVSVLLTFGPAPWGGHGCGRHCGGHGGGVGGGRGVGVGRF